MTNMLNKTRFTQFVFALLLGALLLGSISPAFASTPSAPPTNVGQVAQPQSGNPWGGDLTPMIIGCDHNGQRYPLGTTLQYPIYNPITGEWSTVVMTCRMVFNSSLMRFAPQWVYSSQ